MSFIFQTHFSDTFLFFSSLAVESLTQEVAVSCATIIKIVKILGFQKGPKPNHFLVNCQLNAAMSHLERSIIYE